MNRPPDFNRLARLYRWMEFLSFGPWLSLTRCTFLGNLAHSRQVLVLGDGDGRFTSRLLNANPAVHVDAVDASAAMLQALLRRAGRNAHRVRVNLADLRNWQPSPPIATQPYDLIVTHFFLDCLTAAEVESLAARVRSTTARNALWIVSEFSIPPGWYGRLIAAPIVSCLYLCFGLLTGLDVRKLPDYPAALRKAGFVLLHRRSRLGGLLVAECWSANPPDSPLTPAATPL